MQVNAEEGCNYIESVDPAQFPGLEVGLDNEVAAAAE